MRYRLCHPASATTISPSAAGALTGGTIMSPSAKHNVILSAAKDLAIARQPDPSLRSGRQSRTVICTPITAGPAGHRASPRRRHKLLLRLLGQRLVVVVDQ